jgi:hypothetical protein
MNGLPVSCPIVACPRRFAATAHSRSWHNCDMPVALANVRNSGWTGKHVLVVRISGCGPKGDLSLIEIRQRNSRL